MNNAKHFQSSFITASLDTLLLTIKKDFYQDCLPHVFYRDRKMLIYSLTWPASWLQERGLHMDELKYKELILQRLGDIKKHGKPGKYNAFFPRYLLMCIQKYFMHKGDDLYFELKHVRNSMDFILKNLPEPSDKNENVWKIELLAQLNQWSKPSGKKKIYDHKQMELF